MGTAYGNGLLPTDAGQHGPLPVPAVNDTPAKQGRRTGARWGPLAARNHGLPLEAMLQRDVVAAERAREFVERLQGCSALLNSPRSRACYGWFGRLPSGFAPVRGRRCRSAYLEGRCGEDDLAGPGRAGDPVEQAPRGTAADLVAGVVHRGQPQMPQP